MRESWYQIKYWSNHYPLQHLRWRMIYGRIYPEDAQRRERAVDGKMLDLTPPSTLNLAILPGVGHLAPIRASRSYEERGLSRCESVSIYCLTITKYKNKKNLPDNTAGQIFWFINDDYFLLLRFSEILWLLSSAIFRLISHHQHQ
jgi:hypothetical protein